jgi:hypothetical protein
MPKLVINVEGKGGAYAHRLRGREVIDAEALGGELLLEVLDGGMQSGGASVGIMVLVDMPASAVFAYQRPRRLAVIAQTSLKLFQIAAAATLAKYGDRTGNALIGAFTPGGTAEMTVSEETQCPACSKRIPSSCRYCFNCGAKLFALMEQADRAERQGGDR